MNRTRTQLHENVLVLSEVAANYLATFVTIPHSTNSFQPSLIIRSHVSRLMVMIEIAIVKDATCCQESFLALLSFG
jgi:hypothetical protein